MNGEQLGPSLFAAFAEVPDSRTWAGRRHPLPAILAQATLATLAGATNQRSIWQWGRAQSPAVVRALGFRRDQTPSASTLWEVFGRIDVAAYEAIVDAWMLDHADELGETIALDGKAQKGRHDGQTAHFVAAFAPAPGLVLGHSGGPARTG